MTEDKEEYHSATNALEHLGGIIVLQTEIQIQNDVTITMLFENVVCSPSLNTSPDLLKDFDTLLTVHFLHFPHGVQSVLYIFRALNFRAVYEVSENQT